MAMPLGLNDADPCASIGAAHTPFVSVKMIGWALCVTWSTKEPRRRSWCRRARKRAHLAGVFDAQARKVWNFGREPHVPFTWFRTNVCTIVALSV